MFENEIENKIVNVVKANIKNQVENYTNLETQNESENTIVNKHETDIKIVMLYRKHFIWRVNFFNELSFTVFSCQFYVIRAMFVIDKIIILICRL